MSFDLERWITAHQLPTLTTGRRCSEAESMTVDVRDLRELFAGKVLVNEEVVAAIQAVYESDCGAWLKDCTGALFRCSQGHEKRMELSILLSALYRAAKESQ